MPQTIGETIFDVLYLGFAITAGLIMLIKGNQPLVKKFGLMAVLLGAGDSFHLVPAPMLSGQPDWKQTRRHLESAS